MKCPHCLVEFHDHPRLVSIGQDVDGFWGYELRTCPSCHRNIIRLICGDAVKHMEGIKEYRTISKDWVAYPKVSSRPPCPSEVPEAIANDYKEACMVLIDSPKASAALSRRCLQNLLREKAGVTPSDLSKEIQQVIDGNALPSYLRDDIDAIRVIGNFAAHPNKSIITGEIVPVEPGESEWLLDVLEGLFDFYYVQPAVAQKKRDALNQKLKDAGKQIMK